MINDPYDFALAAWKVTQLAASSQRTKWEIAKGICNFAKLEAANATNDTDREYWHTIQTRWASLRTRLLWGINVYSQNNAFNYGFGTRYMIEKLWTDALGRDLQELPNLEDFSDTKIYEPLTFSEMPPPEIIALENDFDPFPVQVLNEENWHDQYVDYLNCTINDMYRVIGSIIWLDQEFIILKDTTWDSSIDREYFETIWNLISTGGKNFFYHTRSCMAQTEYDARYTFNENITGDAERDKILAHAKYVKPSTEHSIVCTGGLFKINEEKLPLEWKNKITRLPAELQYGN